MLAGLGAGIIEATIAVTPSETIKQVHTRTRLHSFVDEQDKIDSGRRNATTHVHESRQRYGGNLSGRGCQRYLSWIMAYGELRGVIMKIWTESHRS